MRLPARLVSLGGPLVIGLTSILLAVPASRGTLASAAAQQAPSPTGFILGQVVDQATGQPIAGARVSLSASSGGAAEMRLLAGTPGAGSPTVLADEQGSFLLHTLPKGDYMILASAPGYLDGGYGASRPGTPPRPLALDEGERVGHAQIRLWKAATVTGVVSDETGAPVVGVRASLLRRIGGQRIDIVEYGSSTDDRGVYEFRGLAPGEYLVVVPSRMTTIPASVMAADSVAATSLQTSGLRSIASRPAMNPVVRLGDFYVPSNDARGEPIGCSPCYRGPSDRTGASSRLPRRFIPPRRPSRVPPRWSSRPAKSSRASTSRCGPWRWRRYRASWSVPKGACRTMRST